MCDCMTNDVDLSGNKDCSDWANAHAELTQSSNCKNYYTMAQILVILFLVLKEVDLGGKCIQNFCLGWYIIKYSCIQSESFTVMHLRSHKT